MFQDTRTLNKFIPNIANWAWSNIINVARTFEDATLFNGIGLENIDVSNFQEQI